MNNVIIQDDYHPQNTKIEFIVNQSDKLTVITEYIPAHIEGETNDNLPPLPPQRNFKNVNIPLEVIDNLFKTSLKKIRSDPNYRWMERHLSQGITIYFQIKSLLHNDPKYQYMKPYIDKTLTVYSIISLIVTISTMNPIPIMIALYKISS
jgi:hypothetical protein